jgi:DNA-binding response OmpR family regulator
MQAKHTILIVDDDELILNTLKQRFATWDMDVYSAKDPLAAKELMAKVSPELIILDLLLTKDDGSTGVLDFMKSDPRLENIPVIVLTNLEKPELKRILLSQGVKEYLIKGSITLDDLYLKAMGYLEPQTNKQ